MLRSSMWVWVVCPYRRLRDRARRGGSRRARPAVRPTTGRPRRRAHHPQAGRRPARPRRLDPARPDDHPQLGRPAHHPDRPPAGLPPADGAGAAAPLQRRGRRRARRPARTRPTPAPHPDRPWPRHRPGPLGAARPAAPGRRGAAGPRPARGAGALDPGHPGRARPGRRHPGGPQPGPPDPHQRTGALATDPLVDDQHRPGLRPKRAKVIALYTDPPEETTVICADELGPVIPRSFPPAPGWSPDGHRIKAPLEYSRGMDKTWVYGGLRVCDGHQVTMTAPPRNRVNYQRFNELVEQAKPAGTVMVIGDNLSSHTSYSTRTWRVDHPRIQHTFIP